MAWTGDYVPSQSQPRLTFPCVIPYLCPPHPNTWPHRAAPNPQPQNHVLLAAPAKISARRRERGEENSTASLRTRQVKQAGHRRARLRTSFQAATERPWTPCAALSWPSALGRRRKSSLWPSKANMATTACNTPITTRPWKSSSRPRAARTEEKTFCGQPHACYKISRRRRPSNASPLGQASPATLHPPPPSLLPNHHAHTSFPPLHSRTFCYQIEAPHSISTD